MRRHPIVRAGLYPLVAAGTLLAVGGVAESAAASPPTVVVNLAEDCDVIGGQPGGEHAPGGHENHVGGGQTAPAENGTMDHGAMTEDSHSGHDLTSEDSHSGHDLTSEDGAAEHGSHGSSATDAPESGTRTLVLGGFAGVNAMALAAAGLLRRRTASRRDRHVAARSTARPARRITAEGDR
jgi:hypothetical protein